MSLIHHSEIKEGILKCIKHSRRLIKGAKELAKLNEDATAVCLATIAQEEIGKGAFLLSKMINKKDITSKEWKALSQGRKAHINKLSEFKDFINKINIHYTLRLIINSNDIQKIKEGGFYVDWRKGNWYIFDESELTTRVTMITLSFQLISEAEYALEMLKEEIEKYKHTVMIRFS